MLKDTKALFAAFPRALDQVQAALHPVATPRPTYAFWNRGVPHDPVPPAGAVHSFRDYGFDEPGTAVAAVRFQPPSVSVTAEALVVGGGTSGNAAAYASAGLGLKTVCLERGLELGGTNTIGGVTNLWFGNKTKGFDDYYAAMGAKNDGINAPGAGAWRERGLARPIVCPRRAPRLAGALSESNRRRRVGGCLHRDRCRRREFLSQAPALAGRPARFGSFLLAGAEIVRLEQSVKNTATP